MASTTVGTGAPDAGRDAAQDTAQDKARVAGGDPGLAGAGWQRSGEELVASVVALLIHRHVRQLRHFVSTLVGTALLLLVAITSYAFEPYRLLLTCIWVLVGTVVVGGLWVYLQLDRNTLISHLSGTSPDHMTWSAGRLLRLVAWGVVPMLSVAAAQYPDLANLLFRVVAPLARSLN